MAVYLGYQEFKRHNGKVLQDTFANPEIHGHLWWRNTRDNVQYFITTRSDDSLREQARTVIHELLHIGLEGDDLFLFSSMGRGITPSEMDKLHEYLLPVEAEVRKLTDEVYSCQPRFVEHIMRRFLKVD